MPKTLLLADDSVTIQKVVGISFANEDFVLQTVDNGDDAIARAREVRPDIVLADVVMPGKNGYEVCEAIKSEPELAHVPVLLLTGTFEAFDEERARRVGADGHITKPFEAQALVDAVKQRLAAAAPRPVAAAAPAASPSPDAATMQGSASGFDFLEDEHTEPSGVSSGDGDHTTVLIQESGNEAEEAFAFEASEDGEGLEIGDSELDLEPDLGDTPDLRLDDDHDARTQVVMDDQLSDSFETADTLPPRMVPAEPEDDASGPLFGGGEDALDAAGSLELASEPEPTEDPFGHLDEAFGDPLAADAGDAVLDPSGARDYDVSSSDLGDPLEAPAAQPAAAPAPEPAAEALAAPEPPPVAAAPPALPPQSDDDLLSRTTDPQLDADAFLMDASTELTAPEEPVSLEEPPEVPQPAAAAPALEPAAPEQPAAPPPLPTAPAASAPAPAASAPVAAAIPDLEPLLRDQLHGTLEKIAWEAFGDATERLVKDALERIERVAWEVIPQMAETLIREEIRKLKGGE